QSDSLANIQMTSPGCRSSRNDHGVTVNSRAYSFVDIEKGRTKGSNDFRLRRAGSGEKQRGEERTELPASPSCRSMGRSRIAIQPGGNCIIRPHPNRRIET